MEKCLTEAPVLALPSGRDGFVVYTDASKDCLECVLILYDKVIAYASRKLKHKRNYLTHDLELVAAIFALKKWRHYLYGVTFEVLLTTRALSTYFFQKS